MNEEVIQLLERAIVALETDGWTTFDFGGEGEPHCIDGALLVAAGYGAAAAALETPAAVRRRAREAVRSVVGHISLWDWNDTVATYEDVVLALKQAIERLS